MLTFYTIFVFVIQFLGLKNITRKQKDYYEEIIKAKKELENEQNRSVLFVVFLSTVFFILFYFLHSIQNQLWYIHILSAMVMALYLNFYLFIKRVITEEKIVISKSYPFLLISSFLLTSYYVLKNFAII